jgi:hypothetical protein
MLFFLISLSFLWTYEGDSLYNGLSKGTVIAKDSVMLGNELEKFPWESRGFLSGVVKIGRDIYIGISDAGMVIRLKGGKTADTVFCREGGLISLGKKGTTLVAGVSPMGKLFFIEGSKIIDSLSVPDENIYCMFEFAGSFLIGTGPEGKIYKLSSSKDFEEYYKTQAASVTNWVVKDKNLFVGTTDPGLVYRIEKSHDGRIYYDPGFEEINGLGFVGDTLCVSGFFSKQEELAVGCIKFYSKNREYVVYKGTPILCGKEIGGKFYAGESEDGQVGEFRRNDFDIVIDLDESKVSKLEDIDGEMWIGTGYPAKIYRVKNKKVKEGEYISSVFKGGVSVIWGNLTYEGRGDIKFFVRGGKKEEVDSSWSKWEKVSNNNIAIEEPFIQWKAVLNGDKANFKKVQISYGKQNSPPRIKEIGVLPPKIGTGKTDADNPVGMPIPAEQRDRLVKAGFLIPDDAYVIPEGIRCIFWEASDPDNDRLLFDLFVSRDSKNWDKITGDLLDYNYFLNTYSYPDGNYYVRIVARDDLDETSPLRSEKETSFLVDYTPPTVTGIEKKYIADSVEVSGTAADELSDIMSVMYNTKETKALHWKSARSTDKLFDEKEEKFVFKVEKKEKYVAIRVLDKSGNSKIVRIEF